MELIDALEQTFQHAEGVIGNVRADQYDDPTPCPDWAVRDLLGHADTRRLRLLVQISGSGQ